MPPVIVTWHYLDTNPQATLYNDEQDREHKASYLHDIRRPLQRSAMPDRVLEMCRLAVRVRSLAVYFCGNL
jgi:hypothetical protein